MKPISMATGYNGTRFAASTRPFIGASTERGCRTDRMSAWPHLRYGPPASAPQGLPNLCQTGGYSGQGSPGPPPGRWAGGTLGWPHAIAKTQESYKWHPHHESKHTAPANGHHWKPPDHSSVGGAE
jgi:hypothetical protein